MWHSLAKTALQSAVSTAASTTVDVAIRKATASKPPPIHVVLTDNRDNGDVESKLKEMSRKDLFASTSFFNEGFVDLCQVFGEGTINIGEEITGSTAPSNGPKAKVAPGSSRDLTIFPSTAWLEAIFLFKSLKDLDDSAEKALSDAKEKFKDARKKATEAFGNEALSARDRIFALRCRVAATLLEKVDNPIEALGACKLCLEQLHAMPVVRKSFKESGGSQSIQADVRDVNSVMCDVTQLVGSVGGLLNWPCVVVAERQIDPLHNERMISEHCCLSWSFGQEGDDAHKLKFAWSITSNTRGDFIVPDRVDRNIKFFDSNSKFLFCRDPFEHESRFEYEEEVWDVASDQQDNIYVLTLQREDCIATSSKVHVFDKDGHLIEKLDLREGFRGFSLAVDDYRRIFVMGGSFSNCLNNLVEVYNMCGGFVQSFGTKHLKNAQGITIADEGRVMVLDGETRPFVIAFSVDGERLHKFKVTGSLPDSGVAIAFHKTSKTVLVASLQPGNRVRVSMYHSDGHLVRVIQLKGKGGPFITGITATAKGRIAVPGQNTVLFC